MIRRLIILLLIVGCEEYAPTNHTHTDTGTTVTDTLFVYDTLIVNYDTTIFIIDTVYIDYEVKSSCILIVDENFQICTEELNEAECYSYYTFHNTFWSNSSSCNELNYSTIFDPCLNIEDTYQEITHCDIDWFLNNEIGEISEWTCTTDYPFEPSIVYDSFGEILQYQSAPDTVLYYLNIIYNSIEECIDSCPNEALPVTTIYAPDGTGEYFSMYCGYCIDMNLEAECYIDNEGNNYGNSLPVDFSSGASIENCPDDYYDCSVEADKITTVTTNLGNPTDTPLTVLIRDNCSTIIDTTHSGNYTAGWHQFSYDGTNLGTGVYQQVFISSGSQHTRNFYICNP